jgi:hypothetical protein
LVASTGIIGGLGIMRTSVTTETHKALGISPSAPWRVLNIKIKPGYRIQVTFMDGSTGWLDLSLWLRSGRIDGSVFDALREEDFLELATVELGVITWPNGADLSSDALYDEIHLNGEWKPILK